MCAGFNWIGVLSVNNVTNISVHESCELLDRSSHSEERQNHGVTR
jgi:hypothetical protein